MSLSIGDVAPDFMLMSSEKEQVKLSNYEGKNVVLLFFPLAFTGVCTTELCNMRDDIASYNNLDAEIIGVSVDSFFTLGKFKEEQKLNFTLISDFNKEVSRSYGAYYEEFFGMRGVSKRSAFVIDKAGKIQYAEVLEDAGELPNFDKVKETLASLN